MPWKYPPGVVRKCRRILGRHHGQCDRRLLAPHGKAGLGDGLDPDMSLTGETAMAAFVELDGGASRSSGAPRRVMVDGRDISSLTTDGLGEAQPAELAHIGFQHHTSRPATDIVRLDAQETQRPTSGIR